MTRSPIRQLAGLLSLSWVCLQPAHAVEGMWQPEQLPEIKKDLAEKGFQLKPESVTDLTGFPMNAIVSLGGCSASFVSDQGLVVTNHHCAYGSIQYNSTTDRNLLEDGFVANRPEDELPAAPGSRVLVTVAIQDVTADITKGLAKIDEGLKRFRLIDDRKKALIAACEEDEGHRCRVDEFFGGSGYRLTKQLEIKDVRLAYAPPSSVGKYGGDVDNWMWPRHTGDFAFYRAYVNQDGKPVEYSNKNVPYKPKHYLRVNSKGVKSGDFVMVAGYPGRTNRHRLADEVEYVFETAYPRMKSYLDSRIELMEKWADQNEQIRIKYAGRLAGFNNYSKNIAGKMKGYEFTNLLVKKRAFETKFIKSLKQAKNQEANQNYQSLLKLIAQDQADQKLDYLNRLLTDSAVYKTAKRLYRLALEKQKPDSDREAGYQGRDLPFWKQRMIAMSRRFDPQVDLDLWLTSLREAKPLADALEIPDAYRNLLKLSDSKLKKELKSMYEGTILKDQDVRLKLMNSSVKDFQKSQDPFIQLAVATFDYHKAREIADKAKQGLFQKLRSRYMTDLMAFYKDQDEAIYPDANSTLRISYGTVQGYTNREGETYQPFTQLEGIARKHVGKDPFNAPKKQLSLIKNKTYGPYIAEDLKSVPVNFLADLDITGGNSGSATLNGKAELIGLVFDGTIDGVISDWVFEPTVTRSIHVDIRYMLWTMRYLDEADGLLKEMGVLQNKS